MGQKDTKRYWKSPEERDASEEFLRAAANEFADPVEGAVGQFSRRSFLKAAGFTVAATTLTGCSRAPVEKAIPFLIQPEEITPGRSLFYASTCGGCSAGCGLLVKNRDGRPIKLEGNPDHPISRGGLCAVGQASLLGLYDSLRLEQPLIEGKPASWDEIDRAIAARLGGIRGSQGVVRFLTGTVISPTLRATIERFLKTFRNSGHVIYDALSSSAILDAQQLTHAVRALPRFHFERAEVIASFDADFLGTWISPVEFTAGYRAARNLENKPPRLSYHVQFESRMSLTGAKADRRVRIAPHELPELLSHLAVRLARWAGMSFAAGNLEEPSASAALLDELAERLWQARGRSLIVCGSQEVALQVLANFLNHVLGNYGSTVNLEHPCYQRQGDDRALGTLLSELAAGQVAALFLYGVNPIYELPGANALAKALERVPLVVSFAERVDETSKLAHFVCPDHHFLESWSDAEPVDGVVNLFQPAIHPLGNTRSVLESLASWMGTPKPAYELLREHWAASIFRRQTKERSFQTFWDRSVEPGYAQVEPKRAPMKAFRLPAVHGLPRGEPPAAGTYALVLYPKVAMRDGRHAHNAWLEELPDPITKVAWDNYACLSPATATRLEVSQGDVIRIESSDGSGQSAALELPVYVQPGQHDSVVAVALGYGREGTERFAKLGPQWLLARAGVGADGRVGVNATPLLRLAGGNLHYTLRAVRLTKTGKKSALACTQTHHTLTVPENLPLVGGEHREVVRETTLPLFLKESGEAKPGDRKEKEDLWPADHPYTGHRWGMVIDLNACTGCSACVIACQAENNIPVVGKDEVRRQREMHWMRIDRYYTGDGDVDVVHQPMLCQQCDYAPCETVCPVLATVHSEEGLNQQIYNRCVGTRYCSNNCPYKTRRFNWFEYAREDQLQNLALNPDVTVRSRGVMEKCTFCVQRIQEAKMEARRRGRGEAIADGTIQTACQQSCPAEAIVFGDLNDPKSRLNQLAHSSRRYRVLEELNFRPAVAYLAVVRNRREGEEPRQDG